MKKLLALLLLAASLSAASAPTVTTTFFRFQCDPTFDANGTPTSAIVHAFWKSTMTVGSQTFDAPLQSASWDAAASSQSVTITTEAGNTITLTDRDVLAAVMAAANRVKAAP
jgi:hypothetical protein